MKKMVAKEALTVKAGLIRQKGKRWLSRAVFLALVLRAEAGAARLEIPADLRSPFIDLAEEAAGLFWLEEAAGGQGHSQSGHAGVDVLSRGSLLFISLDQVRAAGLLPLLQVLRTYVPVERLKTTLAATKTLHDKKPTSS